MRSDYIPFTEEMKRDYTILIPTMLPMHFELIKAYLSNFGYKMELLRSSSPEIAETGLKYVHNDACYPAILVIGQFMEAVTSGRYDPHKLALIYFQTGGGCRASNYIPMLRRALKQAGYEYVPVISFSFAGLEKHPGFRLTPSMLYGMLYAVTYGDLLMSLVNQCKPYEKRAGEAEELAGQWVERLGRELGAGRRIKYADIKRNYLEITRDFASIPRERRDTVKVGVVGEIFVKYSPLGNNDLEAFLVRNGAEVVVPGLLDFLLYATYNGVIDYKLYGRGPLSHHVNNLAYKYLCKKKRDMIAVMEREGTFDPPMPFERTAELGKSYMSNGVKMGEGWLLTYEMLELAESGCKNIVCTQPFGCLPNHIIGKGMMRPVKERNPDVNIVAIDYDASATRVNQENRLKLMLSNARRIAKETAQREQPAPATALR